MLSTTVVVFRCLVTTLLVVLCLPNAHGQFDRDECARCVDPSLRSENATAFLVNGTSTTNTAANNQVKKATRTNATSYYYCETITADGELLLVEATNV
jgi:hypothetical protein